MNQSNLADTSILSKPIWRLTGADLYELINLFFQNSTKERNDYKKYASGIQALCHKIGYSNSTLYKLRKDGVLEGAIVFKLGNKVVYDVDMARQLVAEHYQQRGMKKNKFLKLFNF